jgi:3-hydroxyisobutyrate dehydrogenase-like beta-hydroxyacid dehydrogenase
MTIIAKDVGIVMDESRLALFPAPLCSVAEQVFSAAIGAGMGREDDGRIVKMWEQYGVPKVEEQGSEEEEIGNAKELVVKSEGKITQVLVIGLGIMGKGMAASIAKAGIEVVGYDSNSQAVQDFETSGAKVTKDLAQSAKTADVVLFMTNTAAQAERVLFGEGDDEGISAGKFICFVDHGQDSHPTAMPKESVVIISSTVAPVQAIALAKRLEGLNKGISLIDAPVAGGPIRASKGDLCLMISGPLPGLSKAHSVLSAMATSGGNQANLHFIGMFSLDRYYRC